MIFQVAPVPGHRVCGATRQQSAVSKKYIISPSLLLRHQYQPSTLSQQSRSCLLMLVIPRTRLTTQQQQAKYIKNCVKYFWVETAHQLQQYCCRVTLCQWSTIFDKKYYQQQQDQHLTTSDNICRWFLLSEWADCCLLTLEHWSASGADWSRNTEHCC